MYKLHPLTITIVTETVDSLMLSAYTNILDEYTCHKIADAVRIRLQEQHDWTYRSATDQACLVSKVLERLGRNFCDERDYEIHYSFILNHVDHMRDEWEPEYKQNHVFYRAAVHALRLDWLLYLQQDLRG